MRTRECLSSVGPCHRCIRCRQRDSNAVCSSERDGVVYSQFLSRSNWIRDVAVGPGSSSCPCQKNALDNCRSIRSQHQYRIGARRVDGNQSSRTILNVPRLSESKASHYRHLDCLCRGPGEELVVAARYGKCGCCTSRCCGCITFQCVHHGQVCIGITQSHGRCSGRCYQRYGSWNGS